MKAILANIWEVTIIVSLKVATLATNSLLISRYVAANIPFQTFVLSFAGKYNYAKLGYNEVVTLPAGASYIKILQRGVKGKWRDGHSLALMDHRNQYILNGNFELTRYEKHIDVNGKFHIFAQHIFIFPVEMISFINSN